MCKRSGADSHVSREKSVLRGEGKGCTPSDRPLSADLRRTGTAVPSDWKVVFGYAHAIPAAPASSTGHADRGCRSHGRLGGSETQQPWGPGATASGPLVMWRRDEPRHKRICGERTADHSREVRRRALPRLLDGPGRGTARHVSELPAQPGRGEAHRAAAFGRLATAGTAATSCVWQPVCVRWSTRARDWMRRAASSPWKTSFRKLRHSTPSSLPRHRPTSRIRRCRACDSSALRGGDARVQRNASTRLICAGENLVGLSPSADQTR